MRIYDQCIKDELALIEGFSGDRHVFDKLDERPQWPDGGVNDLIFEKDMAFELGAGKLYAISEQLISTDAETVPGNEVVLIGPDLCDIKENISIAKVVLVRVTESAFTEENAYDRIRAIQYTRFHVHPLGFMSRVSPTNFREQVRVSKKAIKDGISFADAGRALIDAYLKHKTALAVKVIYITDPSFDFQTLQDYTKKSEEITKALDHVLKDLSMNCNTCGIKEICDEVEGMRELHFSQK